MIYNLKIPALLVLLLCCLQSHNSKTKDIVHNVKIHHPGEKQPIEAKLIQHINDEGLLVAYSMDVESVICFEKVCKIITVTLRWDAIGNYKTYNIEDGKTLEKWEADKFEKEDYTKLQSILSNPDSPFKDVYIYEILAIPSDSNEEVDALSGATILQLDDKDTVRGAALTCYTLWHWANGETRNIIKDISSKSITKSQALQFLVQDESHYKIALKALAHKHIYSETILKTTLDKILKEDNKAILKSTFIYYESMDNERYFKTLLEVFKKGNKHQKLAVIESLKTSKKPISNAFIINLSEEAKNLKYYQEITSLLDFLDSQSQHSKEVIANIFPLLNSDFIVARRAYWYLSQQLLSIPQQKKINEFYKKNKSKL